MPNRGFYGFSNNQSPLDIPTLISNCVAWFDVSQMGGTYGQAVTYLNSFTGGPGAAGVGGIFRPNDPFGPAIEVNLTKFSTQYSFTNPLTIMYLSRMKPGGTKGRILSSDSQNWLMGFQLAGMDRYYANGWVYNPSIAADDVPHLYTCTQTGTVSTFWNKTTQLASNGNGNIAPGTVTIGGNTAGNNEPSNFYFYEFIGYSRVLRADEILTLQTYMINKWHL